jgi:hypothetical protein
MNSTFVPQADDLELVYGLVRTRLPDVLSSHDLAKAFGIHGRHAAYALEAATELGLLRRFRIGLFSRDALGDRVAAANEQDAYRLFVMTVLRLPVLRRLLAEVRADPKRRVTKDVVERIVVTSSNGRYSGSTVGRRATTVVAWVLWLENNVWFASTP